MIIYLFPDNESCASDDSYVALSPGEHPTVSPCHGKVRPMYTGLH